MTRKNIIKQTISSLRAIDLFEKNGIYNLDKKDKAKALSAYSIPVKRFDNMLQLLSHLENDLQKFINQLSVPIQKVTYEDLLNDYDETIEIIFKFLGTQKVTTVQNTYKHTSDNLRHIVSNYEELKTYYKETKYERWFE